MIIFALVLVALFFVVKYVVYVKRIHKCIRKYPGPKGVPVLGCALEFGSSKDILPAFLRYQNEYGGMVQVPLGFEPNFVIVSDCKVVEFILSSSKILDKGTEYNFLHKWLGLGLLTSTGTKWQKRRKLITPTYHFQILEQFVDVFSDAGDILVKSLRKEVGRERTDIYSYITLCALDVICETAMGISVNAQKNERSEYTQAVRAMSKSILDRSVSPLLMYDVFFYFSGTYRMQKRALKILHGTTDSVIKERRQFLSQASNKKSNLKSSEGKVRLAFLDMLLQSSMDGEKLSDADIREEVDTFMFEGHDTTASGISFTLYSLSEHPVVQKRVVEELHSIFGDDKNRPCTSRDLREMKYLEMVIKESLRLYPPVPIYTRNFNQDILYEGNVFPKGLSVGIFAFGIHRNPEIYPDPEKFIPERFSMENKIGRHPYAYIPFSAGPRNCIGQKFAMMELKSTISKVLRNYEILPVSGYEPILSSELILKSCNGIMVQIKERGVN